MRDFLDLILDFIGSESLTDEEYASSADLSLTAEYTEEVYDFLRGVLEARENVSEQVDRLSWYFQANGLDVGDDVPSAQSNILVGLVIGDD